MRLRPMQAEKLERYFLYFVIYSLLGWCYEVFLEVAVYRWGFSNRGVLFGPYCPVYGIGALAFLILIDPLIRGGPEWPGCGCCLWCSSAVR